MIWTLIGEPTGLWLFETVTSPAFLVLLAAAMAAIKRDMAGTLGLIATATAAVWALLAPEGVLARAMFLGLEVHPVHVDTVSRLVGFVFAAIGFAGVLYAMDTDADPLLIALALSYVGTSLGAVFAGDWLTLVVWWELMAVTSTLVVWHHGGAAVRSGFRYAVLHGLGGSLLLAAVVVEATTGSVLLAGGFSHALAAPLAALGIGVNVGFVGLHAWLPDTYPAPHVAASVFLSVYTTKTGVYALLRAFPDGHLWIAYMGLAMAAFGVVMALFADDVRALLAYSIQSQVGYMVAGAGLATLLARQGAIGHIANHILYKALLFMVAGALVAATGRQRLSRMGGLARAMPWTFGAFVVAGLAIGGVPGLNGFVTKGMIADAAHDLHLDRLYWGLNLVGIGTLAAFVKVGYCAFLREAPDDEPDPGTVQAPPRRQRILMASLAGVCVVLGLFPGLLFAGLPGGHVDAHPFTLDHLAKGGAIALGGVVFFALARPLFDRVRDLPDVDALYNPLVFHATRWTVAAVDGAGRLVDGAGARVGRWIRRIAEDPLPTERAGVGASVLLVTLALAAALAWTVL